MCASHAAYEQASYSETGKEKKLKDAIFRERPDLYCWVIDADQPVVGYFTYTFDYSTWGACRFLYLDCLYIEPEYRGHGIGAEIFKKLQAIAKENDCSVLQWQTPDFNERAIRFYRRMGATGKNKVRFFKHL